MTRLGFVACILATALPAFAASPDPRTLEIPAGETLRARDLILKLGSESFPEREQAHRDLARMGRLAKPALVEAVASAVDPEIRRRVVKLLPKASDDDLKARVAAFLADSEGKFDHQFPGWTSFQTIAGKTADSRALFAEMLKDSKNLALLGALEGPTEHLSKLFSDRKQEIWQWKYPNTPNATRREPTLADMAVLVLVEAENPKLFIGPYSLSSMLTNTTFFTRPSAGPKLEAFRSLLSRWVSTRDAAATPSLYQAMLVATAYDLKEAAVVAAKLLDAPKVSVYYRGTAIAAIARLVAREQLPALEKCLDDVTMYTRVRLPGGGPNETIELRIQDAALAAALIVTGQKPEDYGFIEWVPTTTGTARSRYINKALKEADRAAAFAKWAAWRKANPDAKK